MRQGKELIGKPIYSVSDGRHLGAVRDLYLDSQLDSLMGLYLGSEGLFSRRASLITWENVQVLGLDAVLVHDSDVVTDSNERPEVAGWMRREDLQGRNVETPGGTKVGTIGDVLLDEEARVVGFTLGRVFVEGPIAETRRVLKSAVITSGAADEVITVDLAKAEQPPLVKEFGEAPAEEQVAPAVEEEEEPALDMPEEMDPPEIETETENEP
jgi:uncharacterized protein YrrD